MQSGVQLWVHSPATRPPHDIFFFLFKELNPILTFKLQFQYVLTPSCILFKQIFMCLYVSVYNSCYAVVHFSVADITVDLNNTHPRPHTLDHTPSTTHLTSVYIKMTTLHAWRCIIFILFILLIFACNMVWDNCSFSLCNGCIDVNNCYLSRDQSVEYM